MDFNERLAERQKGRGVARQPSKDFRLYCPGQALEEVTRGGNLVDLDDEARHQLRITAKKLRYAAEFFSPLCMGKAETKRHKRFITAMEGLQDQLGSLNDLATAPDMLSKLALSGVPGAGDLVSAADKARF